MYHWTMSGLECNKEQDGSVIIEVESMESQNSDDGTFERLPIPLPVQDDSDGDCFNLFYNSSIPSMSHTFLGYISNIYYDNTVDGTILIIVMLDSDIIANIELLTVQVKRGSGRHITLTILHVSNLKLVTEQLIGCITNFVDQLTGD